MSAPTSKQITCAENGGHFWPKCMRCGYDPGWVSGENEAHMDRGPLRSNPHLDEFAAKEALGDYKSGPKLEQFARINPHLVFVDRRFVLALLIISCLSGGFVIGSALTGIGGA